MDTANSYFIIQLFNSIMNRVSINDWIELNTSLNLRAQSFLINIHNIHSVGSVGKVVKIGSRLEDWKIH